VGDAAIGLTQELHQQLCRSGISYTSRQVLGQDHSLRHQIPALSNIIPKDGPTALALADVVGNFPARDKSEGALFQDRQGLPARAFASGFSSTPEHIHPRVETPRVAAMVFAVDEMAHPAPTYVFGPMHADSVARLNYGVRRSITIYVDGS
jgi:hypothetical protein